MFIASFDPGQTTGYVGAEWNPTDGFSFDVLEWAEITWGERLKAISDIVRLRSPQVFVIEEFRLYHKAHAHQTRSDFPSVRVIGHIEQAIYEAGLQCQVIIQPASMKTGVQLLQTDETKILKSRHVHDAYKHLRSAIVRGKVTGPR